MLSSGTSRTRVMFGLWKLWKDTTPSPSFRDTPLLHDVTLRVGMQETTCLQSYNLVGSAYLRKKHSLLHMLTIEDFQCLVVGSVANASASCIARTGHSAQCCGRILQRARGRCAEEGVACPNILREVHATHTLPFERSQLKILKSCVLDGERVAFLVVVHRIQH